MKDLQTGEITPPLEHDEWLAEHRKAAKAEQRAKAKKAGAAPSDVDEEDDEPTFHGKPLSFFEGMSDEQITAIPGIADGTLAKIRTAQKKR